MDEPNIPRSYFDLALWREYCEMLCEDEGSTHIEMPRPASSWRDLPPTPKQLAALRRSGCRLPTTRGEASDLINVAMQQRGRPRPIPPPSDWSADDLALTPRDWGDL